MKLCILGVSCGVGDNQVRFQFEGMSCKTIQCESEETVVCAHLCSLVEKVFSTTEASVWKSLYKAIGHCLTAGDPRREVAAQVTFLWLFLSLWYLSSCLPPQCWDKHIFFRKQLACTEWKLLQVHRMRLPALLCAKEGMFWCITISFILSGHNECQNHQTSSDFSHE